MKPFIVTQWDLATEPSGGVWLDGPDKRHFFPYGTELYTSDQLKAAQVAVLREAAEKFDYDCKCGVPCDCYGPVTAKFQLLRIADELSHE